jgi:two-component system, response regulator PdtaR
MTMLEAEAAPSVALRILIIEDDAFIALLYEDIFSEMGHSVCAIARTELDAVIAAKRHRPDLMVVDASLREGSGVVAVREILRDAFVPHIFVSGDPRGIRALVPGAIVVQKPFFNPDLSRAIQKALTATPRADAQAHL